MRDACIQHKGYFIYLSPITTLRQGSDRLRNQESQRMRAWITPNTFLEITSEYLITIKLRDLLASPPELTPPPATPEGGSTQVAGPTAGVARGGQARFPDSSTTSTRRTMPKPNWAAPQLASLLDGRSPGELIPELAHHGLQHLIELEFAAFPGANWYERTEERFQGKEGRPSRQSHPPFCQDASVRA